ncbi:histidine phosphatase family protein [Brevibacterium sp. p3-SID960]|uniref:histidine phosphatase family protein n=1 Tax=Brevibacterium sp. p3-SID960 TaxID=2916063 RepID=UPI0021A6CC44|nr:histidine phosphatase family protein [Brevibacterium sp. p3-SID960]MCT1691347.1 histidine phosphatase family protein [Brevibacterium sp. p3-SID960]
MVQALYFVRHGETDYNREGRFQGHADIPLNARGREQAAAVAAQLAGHGIRTIVSSDLSRARETADAIAGALGVAVEENPLLRELNVGDWQAKTRQEISEIWPEQLAAWLGGQDMRPPGGESRSESANRVVQAIRALVAEIGEVDGAIAIVAHGAVLRGAAEELLGMSAGSGSLGVLGNCAYGVLTPRRDAWVLRSWGMSATDTPA